LTENLRNLLVFDASTANIFFGGISGGRFVFKAESYEKSKLSRFLPGNLAEAAASLEIDGKTRVVIGNGPGAFTGIKTGTAFFLAYIYSRGITKVETVSSFSFVSALAAFGKNDLRLVLIPFNKGEYFAAVLDRESRILKGDIFIKPPYGNISELFGGFAGETVDLVSAVKCGDEILPELKKVFNINELHFEGFEFKPENFNFENMTEVVDITKEPYIVNHVVLPANLDKNGNFYVSDCLAGEKNE